MTIIAIFDPYLVKLVNRSKLTQDSTQFRKIGAEILSWGARDPRKQGKKPLSVGRRQPIGNLAPLVPFL